MSDFIIFGVLSYVFRDGFFETQKKGFGVFL